MGGKAVAYEVKGTPSTKKIDPDTCKSGAWKLMMPELKTPSMKLFSEKGPTLLDAKAFFIYLGGQVSTPAGPVPLPPVISMVDLKPEYKDPEKKVKTDSSKLVLVDGNEKKDPFENKLAVDKLSEKFKTA